MKAIVLGLFLVAMTGSVDAMANPIGDACQLVAKVETIHSLALLDGEAEMDGFENTDTFAYAVQLTVLSAKKTSDEAKDCSYIKPGTLFVRLKTPNQVAYGATLKLDWVMVADRGMAYERYAILP